MVSIKYGLALAVNTVYEIAVGVDTLNVHVHDTHILQISEGQTPKASDKLKNYHLLYILKHQ